MENFPTWYLGFLGVVVPIITNFITSKNWSRNTKSGIALGVSIVIGFGGVYFAGKLDTVNLLATIGLVFTMSQLSYDQFFKSMFNK